jgi:hypothetical protein
MTFLLHMNKVHSHVVHDRKKKISLILMDRERVVQNNIVIQYKENMFDYDE